MSTTLDLLGHELRSPVAALAALADEAGRRRSTLTPGQLRQIVSLAVAAGRDMERLLEDDDLFSVRAERIEIASLVAAAARDLLVETRAGIYVVGDPTRLRQALENLIANAKRHGTHVAVEVVADAESVRISVADDGPGLPQGMDVFEAGRSGAGSTGLGLYVARRVAEAHGGALDVRSEAQGTTFTLALPRAAGDG